MQTIIYKGVEIQKLRKTEKGLDEYYVFVLNGMKFINTNLHFAKVVISRELKLNPNH